MKNVRKLILAALAVALLVVPALAAEDGTAALLEALKEGGEITLTGPINLTADQCIEVTKDTTIDLNGQTITAQGDAFVVKGDNVTLTINGNGTVNAGTSKSESWTAVWAYDGGTAIINGGTYSVDAAENDYNDLIYCKGGNITINGGYFNSENTQWSANDKYYVVNQNNSKPGTVVINGGTFENFDPTQGDDSVEGDSFIPSGVNLVRNEDGSYGVGTASIGDIYYASPADAIAAAEPGETVTLTGPIELTADQSILVTKETTIDLNGQTVTAQGDAFVVRGNSATLTINGNGTVNAGTSKSGSWTAVWAYDGGTAIINGGTYSVDAAEGDYNDLIYCRGGNITINGGYFNSENTQWSANGKYYVVNQNNSNPGTVVINGGTFENFDPTQGDDSLGSDSFSVPSGGCVYTNEAGAVCVAEHSETMEDVAGTDATCTEAGIVAHKVCACGKLWSADGSEELESVADTVEPATGHKNVTQVAAKAATCTEDGHEAHYLCGDCDKLYADKELTEETTLEELTVKAAGHKLTKVEAKEATYEAAGNKEYHTCQTCGKYYADAEGKQEITDKTSVVIAKLAKPDPTNPNTGDNTLLTPVIILMALSAMGIAVLIIGRKKF